MAQPNAMERPDEELLTDPVLRGVPLVEGYPTLGPCVLYDRLGEGGMGKVFLARHAKFGFDVAVKVLKRELSRMDLVQRFQREARISGQLNSPNLVRVFDVDSDGDLQYVVMEFVKGETARERATRKKQLTESEALEIIYGAAVGLEAAHRDDILHRDIKPDNILIDTKGIVKLADLGLAKAMEDDSDDNFTTTMDASAGTPAFMSPEQCESLKTVRPASDVFSLGMTLYYLLVGHPPFQTSGRVSLMLDICSKDFPDPREKVEVSDATYDLLRRMTDRNLETRIQDGRQLRLEIEKFHTPRYEQLADPDAGSQRVRTGMVSKPPSQATLEEIRRRSELITIHDGGTPEPDKKNAKPALWIGIGAAVLIVAGLGVASMLGGEKEPAKPTKEVANNKQPKGPESASSADQNPKGAGTDSKLPSNDPTGAASGGGDSSEKDPVVIKTPSTPNKIDLPTFFEVRDLCASKQFVAAFERLQVMDQHAPATEETHESRKKLIDTWTTHIKTKSEASDFVAAFAEFGKLNARLPNEKPVGLLGTRLAESFDDWAMDECAKVKIPSMDRELASQASEQLTPLASLVADGRLVLSGSDVLDQWHERIQSMRALAGCAADFEQMRFGEVAHALRRAHAVGDLHAAVATMRRDYCEKLLGDARTTLDSALANPPLGVPSDVGPWLDGVRTLGGDTESGAFVNLSQRYAAHTAIAKGTLADLDEASRHLTALKDDAPELVVQYGDIVGACYDGQAATVLQAAAAAELGAPEFDEQLQKADEIRMKLSVLDGASNSARASALEQRLTQERSLRGLQSSLAAGNLTADDLDSIAEGMRALQDHAVAALDSRLSASARSLAQQFLDKADAATREPSELPLDRIRSFAACASEFGIAGDDPLLKEIEDERIPWRQFVASLSDDLDQRSDALRSRPPATSAVVLGELRTVRQQVATDLVAAYDATMAQPKLLSDSTVLQTASRRVREAKELHPELDLESRMGWVDAELGMNQALVHVAAYDFGKQREQELLPADIATIQATLDLARKHPVAEARTKLVQDTLERLLRRKCLALPLGVTLTLVRVTGSNGRDFYIGMFELTHAQKQALLSNLNSNEEIGRHPANELTPGDITRILQELGRAHGEGTFQVPTKEQWLRAARAEGAHRSSTYWTDRGDAGEYAHLRETTKIDLKTRGRSVEAVGERTPNAIGCYDMIGNVAELAKDGDEYVAFGGSYLDKIGAIALEEPEARPRADAYVGLRVVWIPE